MYEECFTSNDPNSIIFRFACSTDANNTLFINQPAANDFTFICKYCAKMCNKLCKEGGCGNCHMLDMCHEDGIHNCDCKTDEVDLEGKYIICKECSQRIGKKG